jgi:plasmid stabilization system protein ParE
VPRVVWRSRAVRHLEELHRYLESRNPSAADRYLQQIYDSCSRLADFPEQAQRYSDRYRALVVRNYLVFYSYSEERDVVIIAAVIDGRRDISKLLRSISKRAE